MSERNDSVLGNLPRSRPGVRSDKRAGAAAAKPKAAPRPKRAAPKRRPVRERPAPPAARPADPVGLALKAGEAVALTGIRVAGRVAGGVLRRLPRL